jgi:YgiT-type zinc finger domain-containing protein
MYKYDDCSFCGGRVSERRVQKICWWGDKLIAIVDNVPAGVCEQCGERYYQAKILKGIEAFLKKKKFETQLNIPLADFSKAIA